jgi:hexosaminidase
LKYSIIPRPVRYEEREETIEISDKTQIFCQKEFVDAGNFISEYLHTIAQANEGAITFSKAKSIAPEGYAMYTENGGISIKASTPVGAFYAAVTLKWILMQARRDENGKKALTGFLIEDKPCFKHRGLMLDECRHFFGADTVKSLLDNMAMLKMNVFHWHLADDQGYRIESKKFPMLNEVGSKREFAHLRGFGKKNSGGEYGPFFYTQDEIKSIVAYAKALHIKVIPEIDVPGHCTAIVAAYPELGCNGEKVDVAVTNGILKQIFCAGKEQTFDFLNELFDEICPLFDGEYFHIGGDEARYANWRACPECQKLMTNNGLKNEKQLQIYFMNRVNKNLQKRGKKCIAWNDCLNDSLDKSITCQYWISKNKSEVKKQAYKREIILSPMSNFYFDFKYFKLPVDRAYRFNAKKSGFGKSGMNIRGVEAELWTEWIDSRKALEYSVFPRLAATAEVAWDRPSHRNLKDFRRRLKFYKMYLDGKKINYYRLDKPAHGSSIRGWYSFGEEGKEFKNNEKAKS